MLGRATELVDERQQHPVVIERLRRDARVRESRRRRVTRDVVDVPGDIEQPVRVGRQPARGVVRRRPNGVVVGVRGAGQPVRAVIAVPVRKQEDAEGFSSSTDTSSLPRRPPSPLGCYRHRQPLYAFCTLSLFLQ
jgi:hypothetical protein